MWSGENIKLTGKEKCQMRWGSTCYNHIPPAGAEERQMSFEVVDLWGHCDSTNTCWRPYLIILALYQEDFWIFIGILLVYQIYKECTLFLYVQIWPQNELAGFVLLFCLFSILCQLSLDVIRWSRIVSPVPPTLLHHLQYSWPLAGGIGRRTCSIKEKSCTNSCPIGLGKFSFHD